MSGRHISAIIRYEVNADKNLSLIRNLNWPTLRTLLKVNELNNLFMTLN
jgi:hypothetical protein